MTRTRTRSAPVVLYADDVDWQLLRGQKAALERMQALVNSDYQEVLEGMMSMIDTIQDRAIDHGISEFEVFGPNAVPITAGTPLIELLPLGDDDNEPVFVPEPIRRIRRNLGG